MGSHQGSSDGGGQRTRRRTRTRTRTPLLPLVCLILLAGFVSPAAPQQQQSLQELDLSIQSSAFQRLAPLPKTGVIYNVTLDAIAGSKNSTSQPGGGGAARQVVTRVQAVRLRSGSLRRHGLVFNEFTIPVQCLVETTSKYVVLVYRDFSSYPSSPPDGFRLLGPVLGIKAYEGNDLSSSSPQELSVFSGPAAIRVRVPQRFATNSTTFCASFDKEGTVRLTNITSPPNVCVLPQLVDTSLAAASPPSPSPAPAPAPGEFATAAVPESASAPATSIVVPLPPPGRNASRGRRLSKAWKLGVGISVGGIGLAVVAAALVFAGLRTRRRARIARMEMCADNAESLQTALIGGSRAPAAGGTRTRPVLENDYVSP